MDKASAAADFRIVLIGKNQEEKAKLGIFLTSKSFVPYGKLSRQSSVFSGEWKNNVVKCFNPPDLFSTEDTKVKEEIQGLLSAYGPGPYVFLLLVNPSDFIKTDREKFQFILECFGDDAIQYSILVVAKSEVGWGPTVYRLKQDCSNRCTTLNFAELSATVLQDLMERVENLINENQDIYQASPEPIYQEVNREPPLNIVLYGRNKDWKSTTASVLLGEEKNMANLSSSLAHTGDVSGRTVSIVQLPPLIGLKEDAARQESLHCLSQCDPKGIHAFVLVQPLGRFVTEDKQEIDAITRAFTPRMNAFKMILFAEIAQRAKQLKEKHGQLEKAQETRRKYEEKRQEEDKLRKQEDELQIQQWNNRYVDLVKQINTKSDSASHRRSLMIMKEELKREQEAWEQRRHEWWSKRTEEEKRQREEENRRLTVLEREHGEAKKMYEQKKKEDEERRRNEERELGAMQEHHRRQLDALRKQSEEEARRQAEMLNDFQRTYARERDELRLLRERRQSTNEFVLKQISKNKTGRKDLETIRQRHKLELEQLEQLQSGSDAKFLSKEISILKKQHDEEIHEFIQEKVKAMSDSSCAIL
uniref:AIG1-type G domain-containing protein n=1 Tax=Knipowitschia caucasica TaxID=637954 RepID=A0AAV2MNP9_KNICA